MTAIVKRHRAPSGNRDHDRFQAACRSCGWASPTFYSNRTVEGRRLAERDAEDHNQKPHTCPACQLNPTTGRHFRGEVSLCGECFAGKTAAELEALR